jgi:hypothetical protein
MNASRLPSGDQTGDVSKSTAGATYDTLFVLKS